jgi:prophage regulatory protein
MFEQQDLRVRLQEQLRRAEADAVDGLAIWREKEVERRTGLSRTTRYRWERQGRFPRRVPLGPTTSGYLAAEIIGWMRDLVAQRDRQEHK